MYSELLTQTGWGSASENTASCLTVEKRDQGVAEQHQASDLTQRSTLRTVGQQQRQAFLHWGSRGRFCWLEAPSRLDGRLAVLDSPARHVMTRIVLGKHDGAFEELVVELVTALVAGDALVERPRSALHNLRG
eukprot:2002750-Rhodomonas_salina.1